MEDDSNLMFAYIRAPQTNGGGICSMMGCNIETELKQLQLHGYILLRLVDEAEFCARWEFKSTHGTHANKRLRTLKHWQGK